MEDGYRWRCEDDTAINLFRVFRVMLFNLTDILDAFGLKVFNHLINNIGDTSFITLTKFSNVCRQFFGSPK